MVPSSQQQQEEQHQAFLDLTASPLITRGREGNLSRKERRLRGGEPAAAVSFPHRGRFSRTQMSQFKTFFEDDISL